jgi:hypothetical protein
MKAIKDIYSVVVSTEPGTHSTTQTGATIDLANQQENLISIIAGTVTDGTHTPSVNDSPDGTTWTAVDASFIVGAPVALTTDSVQKFSYIGAQRYLQTVVTVSGSPETGAAYTVAALVKPRKLPSA